MQPVIPLDKILERMREEQRAERPQLHAPAPAPPEIRAPEPVKQVETSERGVAIIDFTI
jgi:hypothetical protein